MPGNQLTNAQRHRFLNALSAKWPHILANPEDLAATINDIRASLSIPNLISRKSVLRYAADLSLPPLPLPAKTPAQLAALSKARAVKARLIHPAPTPPTPDYTAILTRIADLLERIAKALEPAPKSGGV